MLQIRQSTQLTDPRLSLLAGAACISVSAMFVKISATGAGTAAMWRCLLALPVLIPLALLECRRTGAPKLPGYTLLAGFFLGIDFTLWGQCIADVGTSIATVLVNVQVIILPLLARLLSKERLSARFMLFAPIMLVAVAVASGAIDHHDAGGHPVRGAILGIGAGAAYAVFLYLLRRGSAEGQVISPVCLATITASLTGLILGALFFTVDLTPSAPSLGWLALLALTGQVGGWLFIGKALPKVDSSVGAALLLLQPILAVFIGIALLNERPSILQLGGCLAVIAVVWLVSRSATTGRPTTDDTVCQQPPANGPLSASAKRPYLEDDGGRMAEAVDHTAP